MTIDYCNFRGSRARAGEMYHPLTRQRALSLIRDLPSMIGDRCTIVRDGEDLLSVDCWINEWNPGRSGGDATLLTPAEARQILGADNTDGEIDAFVGPCEAGEDERAELLGRVAELRDAARARRRWDLTNPPVGRDRGRLRAWIARAERGLADPQPASAVHGPVSSVSSR